MILFALIVSVIYVLGVSDTIMFEHAALGLLFGIAVAAFRILQLLEARSR